MTPVISLTRRYRDVLGLEEVTLDIDGPSITGATARARPRCCGSSRLTSLPAADFDLPPSWWVGHLSRGMRSTLRRATNLDVLSAIATE